MSDDTTHDSVAIGDRFFKVGHWASIWIVQRIFVPKGETLQHVVLEREEVSGDRNVISLSTLLNESDFGRDRRSPDSVNTSSNRRRRTDVPSA